MENDVRLAYVMAAETLTISIILAQTAGLVLLLLNLYGFFLMGGDKWMAKKGRGRIPEKKLLGIAWMGGALGIYIGMRLFRHKTIKDTFRWVPFLVVVEVVLVGGLVWYFFVRF